MLICASFFVKTKSRRTIVKRTYQPHRARRARTHGYRARMATKNGQKVLKARRSKGRHRIALVAYKK